MRLSMPTGIEFHTAQLKESAAASEGEPNALPHTGQVSHELQVNKFHMWLEGGVEVMFSYKLKSKLW